MLSKGDRWLGIRHLRGLLAAIGREAERERAVEKEAGDGFPASTDHARAGGTKDAAGPAAEDYWPSRKRELTLVAGFHAAVTASKGVRVIGWARTEQELSPRARR